MTRLADLKRFYSLLEAHSAAQGGMSRLSEIKSRNLPQRGVYFFFDENEPRTDSGSGPRIIRVGTHALNTDSRSILRRRLTQHRGKNSGGGNHRGSIFRLLVGQALITQEGLDQFQSWGVKGDIAKASAALGVDRTRLTSIEDQLERRVSNYLAQLTLTWISIEDEPGPASLRGFIERNSIALLSSFERPALDAPSVAWLGRSSNRKLVRGSGLWNQRHVDEIHAPTFMDTLESLLETRSGSRAKSVEPLNE